MLWSGYVIHQRYKAEHEEGNFFYQTAPTAPTSSSSLICLAASWKEIVKYTMLQEMLM